METEELSLEEVERKCNELAQEIAVLYNVVNLENKIGRNNLCYCGSGKKFKNCHMIEHEEKEAKLHDLNMSLKDMNIDYIKLKRDSLK